MKEEGFWKLKSCINWLNDGDTNTIFFNLSILNRRHHNRITTLQDLGGNWITYTHHIKNHITNYYQTLFTTKSIISHRKNHMHPSNTLSPANQFSLDSPL